MCLNVVKRDYLFTFGKRTPWTILFYSSLATQNKPYASKNSVHKNGVEHPSYYFPIRPRWRHGPSVRPSRPVVAPYRDIPLAMQMYRDLCTFRIDIMMHDNSCDVTCRKCYPLDAKKRLLLIRKSWTKVGCRTFLLQYDSAMNFGRLWWNRIANL